MAHLLSGLALSDLIGQHFQQYGQDVLEIIQTLRQTARILMELSIAIFIGLKLQ
jgi:hypothetical protein